MQKVYRHGDVNLFLVEKVKGKKVKTNGSYVLAEGEATNSKHIVTTKHASGLEVYKTETGDTYLVLLQEGIVTHTHDHETITVQPGIYRQVPEREVDWFSEGIEKKVID